MFTLNPFGIFDSINDDITTFHILEHCKYKKHYCDCWAGTRIQCSPIESKQKKHPGCLIWVGTYIFFKFHGIVQCTYILLGIISWLLFYLIWENCVLHWDFDLKFWIVDVYTHITHKKYHTKQLLFFKSVENSTNFC